MGDDPDPSISVAYSLPRLITPAIQCSFCNYFWEMYTGEFGWTMSEYGVVSWTCTGSQFVSFILFGGILSAIDLIQKIGGVTAEQAKIEVTGLIEAIGTFLHWLAYFFLIFLPIKWHRIETPFVDSLFNNNSQFLRSMLKGPVALSSMATSRFWWIVFGFPWCFVKLFWVIFYIPMKVCFLCIPISHRRKNVVNITQIPGTAVDVGDIPYLGPFVDISTLPLLSTLESIPLERNNFAMRMRHARQFMGTRTFFLYLLAFLHGVGVSMHELCNKALLTYIYKEDKGTSGNTDKNKFRRAKLGCINLTVFFIAQLIIIAIFSLLKFYVRSGASFSEAFYLMSILFMVIQIPILSLFGKFTNQDTTTGGNTTVPDENPGQRELKVFSLTIFHGTILFWMFSGGPLTFYISMFVLGGDTGIGSFGVLIINIALCGTSWIFMIITIPGGKGAALINDTAYQVATGVCLACELLLFLLFFKHDWSWNKRNWVNYILLIATGIINSVFVTYTNIMLDDVLKKMGGSKWISLGLFYGGTNAIISIGMFFMFKSLGRDEMISIGCKCLEIPFHYCFPTVYRTITLIFIGLDTIAAGLYFGVQ